MDKTQHIFFEPLALNFSGGDDAPDWVQLLPEGKTIKGADGRSWSMQDAPALLNGFKERGVRLPIDIEHSTQIKGALGEPAPAMGWITELEARNSGLWGKVDWNKQGRELITSRSYGYLSPVFSHGRRSGAITRMVSAGLTNNPNLDLVALKQSEGDLSETPMDKILEALGLNSSASEGDAVEAITKLKTDEATARNRAETPDPAKYVPKADYELARNRVQELEQGEEARLDTEITDAVGAAVQAGKIAPASRDYHIAACRAAGGIEEFQKMVGATPEIGGDVDLPDDPGKATGASALSAEELAVCNALDMKPEDYAAQKAADAQE